MIDRRAVQSLEEERFAPSMCLASAHAHSLSVARPRFNGRRNQRRGSDYAASLSGFFALALRASGVIT